MDIKIVTINTWKCDGEYRERMSVLSGQLKRLAPAIIACQECFLSEEAGADTAGWLAGELGMSYNYLACRPKKRYFAGRWVDSYSGMAVLSHFPIVLSEAFDLPGVAEDPGRKAQRVELEILPGQTLVMTNVHLTHLRGATLLRQQQVGEICKRVMGAGESVEGAEEKVPGTGESFSGAGNHTYNLICGDFNAGLESVELTLLKDRAHAADAYTLGGGPEPRTSLVAAFNEGQTHCVDYIFCLPMEGMREGEAARQNYPIFKGAATILNERDAITGLYPSDHFGISTVLVTD